MRSAALALAAVLAVGAIAPAAADDDDEASLLIDDARDELAGRHLDRAARLLDKALAVDPRRIDAYVLRASIEVARKDHAAAIALLEKALALSPNNVDILEALGGAEVLAGKTDAGVARLEGVLAKSPRRYQANAVLGTTYGRRGEWAKAAAALTTYLEVRPASLAAQDARYQLTLAEAHLRTGDVATSRDEFAELVEKRPESVRAKLGLAWATAAIDCGDAMPLLRELAEVAEEHAEVWSVQSRCALLLGEVDEAIRTAARYTEQVPTSAEAWAVLGQARAGKGQTAQAREALGKAVELAPENRTYAFELAKVERASGDPAKAAERLRAAGAPAGREDAWTLELGQASLEAGEASQARDVLEPYVAAHGKDAVARVVLGLALRELGDDEAAIPHLTRGLELGSTDARLRPALIRALGDSAVVAFEAGDLDAATRKLVAATEVGDDDAVWRNLGAIRLIGGDAHGALDALDRAGNDATTSLLRGRAQVALGRWDDAIKALRSAAKAPTDGTFAVDAALLLAEAQRGDGKLDDALETLTKALATKDADVTRVRTAYFATVRSAGTDALSDGRFTSAYELLDAARKKVTADDGAELAVAIDCDLALAATATAHRDRALGLLRPLAKKGTKCPFTAPADSLAVGVLIAWNEGATMKNAKKALGKLDALRKKATGAAATLVEVAARDISVRAAIDAYERGKLKDARKFLSAARRYDPKSTEIDYNLAALDVSLGDGANQIATLEALAEDIPEALVALGIAYEQADQPTQALEAWQRAKTAKIHHDKLDDWIATKRRFWEAP